MPTTFASSLSATQINNLVAFLTKGKAVAVQPPTPPATSKTPQPTAGSAAAGKTLFASQGCTSCHTFTPAAATGTIGPNLNHLAADAAKANRGTLARYAFESIKAPNAYIVLGFPASVMPDFGKTLTNSQIDDLVAFLTHK
jgi:mono/diheme cytochrome c family protein